jgi:hypothetical protein
MLIEINQIFYRFWQKFVNFLPDFFGGILILSLGLVISAIVKNLLLIVFRFVKLDNFFTKTRIVQKQVVTAWEELLAEIIRWTIIILFLVPTLEVWGLSKATAVLNQLLFYLPNVIVAVVVGFIGLVIANLTYDVVRHGVKTLGGVSVSLLAGAAKTIVLFFTVLVVLNQLGVAQDLVRILFTGIVAMLSLAGGLAFGLGGKDLAKEILDDIKKSLQK